MQLRRMREALERHGERFALHPGRERGRGLAPHRDPARFRQALRLPPPKAFGKALGTGVAVPATLHAVAVGHDARGGKPEYRYDERLAAHTCGTTRCAPTSASATRDEHIVAFALIESDVSPGLPEHESTRSAAHAAPVMIDVAGTALTDEERGTPARPLVGG